MKIKLLLTTLFLVTLQFNVSAIAAAPKPEAVKKELAEMLQAPYLGKMDFVVTHMHPKLVKLSGGKETLKKAMTGIFKNMTDAGVNFVSADIGKPYAYMSSDQREFFLVDVDLSLSKGKEKINQRITQIAIKDKGAKVWSYTDSSGMKEKMLRQLFPDTPKQFTLANSPQAKKPAEKKEAKKELVPQP